MKFRFAPAALVVTTLSTALAASAAHAACGNRPGTPNEVKAEALGAATPGSGTIRFSWRNTTSRAHVGKHTMYFDISVRDGKGNQVGKDMSGHGPFSVTYGSRSHQDFTGLSVPSTFCFSIRARTEGGTKGCVSQRFSAQVCATTVATPPAAGPTPLRTTGRRRPPLISVTREAGNVFFISGTGFLANLPVAIRATDNATLRSEIYTTIGGRPITSNASGQIALRLINICKAPTNLSFSANDGRTSSTDKTGTFWSNTVKTFCQ
jgi:hypothetical protein